MSSIVFGSIMSFIIRKAKNDIEIKYDIVK